MSHEPKVLDHEYDGIQEYDNPTPGWWHAIFWATILFSIPYFVIYEMNPEVPTIQDTLEATRTAELRKQFAEIGELTLDEATILRFADDPKWLAVGASMFRSRCASCHGQQGEGGSVGPNMTDHHYKNVKVAMDLAKVIQNGAAGGAMPAWGHQLSTNEVVMLSSFLVAQRGKNLPGPRPAEGEVIPPFGPAK
ncbi:MAG: c-type cytochrome [Phycisphaeraceae bacterium]|nr:MAG: c-type cytochrome [Phycisphaeraceae bacterium]